jgi:ATP-dependent Clp protease ATP-binding subunit ClpX
MFNVRLSKKQLLEALDKIIIGHGNVKRTLINTIYINQEYSRFSILFPNLENPIKRRNSLLVGESGSGKTFLVKSLLKLCDLPYIQVDSSILSPDRSKDKSATYKLLEERINKVVEYWINYDEVRFSSYDNVVSQTVIFIDEFDKLGNEAYVGWRIGIQSSLLSLLESNDCLFILAGAFADTDFHNTRQKKLGFTNHNKDSHDKDYDSLLVKSGIMPEILGRISNVCVMEQLTDSHYKEIIYEILIPKVQQELQAISNTPVNQITFIKEDVQQIIDNATKSNQGVRYVIKQFHRLTEAMIFELEEDEDFSQKQLTCY